MIPDSKTQKNHHHGDANVILPIFCMESPRRITFETWLKRYQKGYASNFGYLKMVLPQLKTSDRWESWQCHSVQVGEHGSHRPVGTPRFSWMHSFSRWWTLEPSDHGMQMDAEYWDPKNFNWVLLSSRMQRPSHCGETIGVNHRNMCWSIGIILHLSPPKVTFQVFATLHTQIIHDEKMRLNIIKLTSHCNPIDT